MVSLLFFVWAMRVGLGKGRFIVLQKFQDIAIYQFGAIVLNPMTGIGKVLQAQLFAIVRGVVGEFLAQGAVLFAPQQHHRRFEGCFWNGFWGAIAQGSAVVIDRRREGTRLAVCSYILVYVVVAKCFFSCSPTSQGLFEKGS